MNPLASLEYAEMKEESCNRRFLWKAEFLFLCSDLHLATTWPCLSEETVVDDNEFS